MPRPRDHWHNLVVIPGNDIVVRGVRRLAKAVRKSVRTSNDRIVVHGPTGSGKTAIVQACQQELGNDIKVLTSKDMARLSDIVDALLTPFLVIEDLQFLPVEAAERFVTIIDARQSRGKATVLTSNVPPAELNHLTQRLTSRLAASLVVGIEPMTSESRILIAQRLAGKTERPISKRRAREIAANSSSLSVRPILAELQKTKRTRLPAKTAESRLTELCGMVATAMNTTIEELRGPSQFRSLSTARQVLTKLAYTHYGLNFRQIESFLDRRGMSMSGVLLDMKLLKDPKLKMVYDQLDRECRNRVA